MATPTTLPAAFVAADVLTAAQMNDLRGAFRVLQVVQATNASTTTITTDAYTAINLSASITPSATTSKILVFATVGAIIKENNQWAGVQLFRGATEIALISHSAGETGTSGALGIGSQSINFKDSPATTSATTYKTQFNSSSNASGTRVQDGSSVSSIILLEIGV
jgi:hypothetical protein